MQHAGPRMLAGLGLAAATGLAVWSWRRRTVREDGLLHWEEVGKVEELLMFPIKSSGGYRVQRGMATNYGLVVDQVLDRSFVVMLSTLKSHVTSAMAPVLGTLTPFLSEGVLNLTALCGDSVQVDTRDALSVEPTHFVFKEFQAKGHDCGDLVADWLSDKLYSDSKQEEKPTVRLMYVGDPADLKRSARKPPYFHFPQFTEDDVQVYHDCCAFMLTSSSSLRDLNGRLATPVSTQQLRPNIVVSSSHAFQEDLWAYVRIGQAGVQLRTLKPREACVRINVRPDNGARQPEVLDTLKRYRVPALPKELAQHWSQKPLFGIHMGLDVGGEIKVGDTVWAVTKKPHWLL